MYAIIDEGGRQHKVTSGQRLLVDRDAEGDEVITFDRVLLVGGAEGGTRVGTPTVSGATVTAKVQGEVKGKKLLLQKHKRRKGYTLKKGHRQQYTAVVIDAINLP